MDEQTQTRAINITTMDEQTDDGNQYTYNGQTNRQGKLKYLRWTNRHRKGQSIYLRWTNRQKMVINITAMEEQTDKGNQYN